MVRRAGGALDLEDRLPGLGDPGQGALILREVSLW